MKPLLAVSLVLNLVMGTLLYRTVLSTPSANVPSNDPSNHPTQSSEVLTPSAQLAPTELDKYIKLQELRKEFVARIELNDQFWRADMEPGSVAYLGQLIPAMDKIRAEVLRLYGKSAVHDPIFTQLFHPLEGQYQFLDSQQQIALQRYQLETQKLFNSGRMAGDALAQLDTQLLSDLGPTAYREYQLRVSPIARQLLSSGATFSESSFRAIFEEAVNANLDKPFRDLRSIALFFTRTRELVDPSSALRIRAVFDPDVRHLQEVANEHRISDDQLLDVLAAIADSNIALFEASEHPLEDVEANRDRTKNIIDDRNEALAAIVGEELTNLFIQARSVARAERTRGRSPQRG